MILIFEAASSEGNEPTTIHDLGSEQLASLRKEVEISNANLFLYKTCGGYDVQITSFCSAKAKQADILNR